MTENTLYIGGPSGTEHQLGDLSNATITINNGWVLDGITIDNTPYGETSTGFAQHTFTMPDDGIFYINEINTSKIWYEQQLISYLHLSFPYQDNQQEFFAGQRHSEKTVFSNFSRKVQLVSIFAGAHIDGLKFRIISNS